MGAPQRNRITVADILAPLDGRDFLGERAFQEAVIRCFNERLGELPPHYDYLDAIAWAVRQNWLFVDGRTITVMLPAQSDVEDECLAVAA